MYTIHQIAKIAKISTRTLRYYDEIGLLKPTTYSSSGYRLYNDDKIDQLQQILFYKIMDFPLDAIKHLLKTNRDERLQQLHSQLQLLQNEQERIQQLMHTIQKTIQKEKGERNMTHEEKFNGFKQKLIAENMEQFGEEIIEQFGSEKVEYSNKRFSNMSQDTFDSMEATNAQLFEKLAELLRTKAIDSALGQEVAQLHKNWLTYSWSSYDAIAHKNLTDMYIADERFKAYYDTSIGDGAAKLLRDCVHFHL